MFTDANTTHPDVATDPLSLNLQHEQPLDHQDPYTYMDCRGHMNAWGKGVKLKLLQFDGHFK